MDYINIALALLTVGFGAFGFLAPRYTAGALDLEPTGSTMGLSELRAGSGGLFVAMGLWCLLTGNPMAYFALGVAYIGAGSGRMLSILIDNPPRGKALAFLAFEWPPAAFLIWHNWPV
ncbi:MAG: DUF4345 family protein [Pseudomonadota bacterium]